MYIQLSLPAMVCRVHICASSHQITDPQSRRHMCHDGITTEGLGHVTWTSALLTTLMLQTSGTSVIQPKTSGLPKDLPCLHDAEGVYQGEWLLGTSLQYAVYNHST